MSADSPRRAVRGVPAIVPPQVVSDPSIIDSVAGFINDVTLTNQPQIDPKDTITWARFETQADISDPQFGDEDWELEGCAPPPLILILGYGVGIQVWAIPANGEAVEVLSWRHGNVTALRVLPTPTTTDVNFDRYSDKRPLMALCEGPTPGSSSQYCTVNFVSLKDSSTVKSIKFKNPVLDILTNKTFVVITFPERIAVFDARSLDDHLSITSCYPSPGINPNPVALGHRWLAYSESRLIHTKRTQGGCEVEGVPSYTATMLNAAKSLGKGLKEFGETVAAGLKGSSSGTGSSSKPGSLESGSGDTKQPGVITIFDIKHAIKDISPTSGTPISVTGDDPIVAHFVAHSDAIVAMEFDPSGMLLLTADKRGHDFHVFKIFNHALSSNLSAVHHLYILHRGDTTAKVQNIAFSPDSRWVAVSTLRGTTHVFPITPYGGAAGVRTHTNPYVVNRLSRFHRSAGLSPDGRSSSPISSHSDIVQYNPICMPYNNVTIPPFPKPVVINPLAKLRQPSVLGSPPGSAQNSYTRSSHGQRQRLSSLSDENGKPLSICAVFAKARSWLLDGPKLSRDPLKIQQKVVDSLFIMAGHGALIQYDLDVKIAQNVAKDKVCDESPIELDVEAKAQWNLGRKDNFVEIQPPLCPDNWLMKDMTKDRSSPSSGASLSPQIDDWVSQVEIMTHAGPGRRLWMGPQCIFKTYNTPSGSSLNHIDTEAVEVPINVGSSRPGRSSPMNMPLSNSGRSSVPFVIESGSYSSIDQSPRLMERFCHDNINSEFDLSQGDSRLREDLADAMRESPSGQHKDAGLTPRVRHMNTYTSMSSTSAKNSGSNSNRQIQGDSGTRGYPFSSSRAQQFDINTIMMSPQTQPARSVVLIEKVVNPQGTVTTITRSPNENEYDPNDPYAWLDTDYVIHENFDEALFRPVVTIFCDDKKSQEASKKVADFEFVPPEPIKTDLIVPVIEGRHPDFEGGKPPEAIKAELVVPVVEEIKDVRKEGRSKTFEAPVKSLYELDEIPTGTTKSKSNKKNTSKGASKEKTPPKDLSADLPGPPSTLRYENENYTGETRKTTSGVVSRKRDKEVNFEAKDKRAKDRVTVTFETHQSELEVTVKEDTNDEVRKTGTSEEKDVKILEKSTSKGNNKIRKISREETAEVVVSKQSSGEEGIKIKSERQVKTKILQEIDQKKMTRVSSDTKIVKAESTEKQNKEIISSSANKVSTPLDEHKVDKNAKSSREFEEKIMEPSGSDGGLQFFDKFGKDSPKTISKRKTETLTESEIEFPSLVESLTENKKGKKSKGTTSSTSPPQASPKVAKKTSQKMGDVKFSDDDVTEVVTITLPSKKRQAKAKNGGGDNNTKKCDNECEKSSIDCNRSSMDKTDSTDHTSIEKTDKGYEAKNGKTKEFPKLALESTAISSDFTEAFLPPLSPLEPFESNFESLHFKEPTGDTDSLINFDSPPQENKSKNKSSKGSSSSTSKLMDESSDFAELKSLHSGYENLIFALCGSAHESTHDLHDEPQLSSSRTSASDTVSVVKVKKYSKESHRKSFENDEQYLSLDRNYHENTSSSSEDIDETSCMRKKTQKLLDDDEELRPLISGANSACSMASSTSGKKEYDTPSIALEIAKAIVDTLPDNSSNQSDSSDQANISDPELQNAASSTSGAPNSTPVTGTLSDPSDSTKTSAQLNLTENGTPVATHQNGKKKLKKKKR